MESRILTDDEDREVLELRFRVPRQCHGWRLDRYLKFRFKRMSRNLVQKVIRSTVTLNDLKPGKPGILVRHGDQVVIRRPVPAEPEVPRTFDVLAEDDAFLAVDKPAGLPVHPTARFFKNTLTTLLKERYGSDPAPTPAHRLDRETSGVLLVARGKESEKFLKDAFRKGAVRKTYLAVVHGRLDTPGTIDGPLGPALDSEIRIKMGVRPDGQPARTEYRPVMARDDFSLVEAAPLTGRQHQIRAHLAELGHPVVGDKIYGVPDRVFLGFIETGTTDEILKTLLLPRQALHAAACTFPHPVTRRPVTVEAPLPRDLRAFLEGLDPPAR